MVNCQKDKMKNYWYKSNYDWLHALLWYKIFVQGGDKNFSICEKGKNKSVGKWTFFSAIHDQLSCIYR